MLVGFPLLIIPFAFFNVAVFFLNMSFTETVFSIPLQPNREMPVDLGDLIVAIGILLLWIELVKAVRPGGKSMIEHIISFLLFAAMAAELVFVPEAESPTLLLLAVLGFVDFMAGISARLAQPKMVYQRPVPAQPAQPASPRS
jgi:hypothetical protein